MKKYVKISLVIAIMITGKQVYGQTVALLTPSDISRTVNVSVSVAKKAKLEVLNAVNTVKVNADDINRGYVDLPSAVVLKLWCNSIEGARIMGKIDPSSGDIKGKLMFRISGECEFRDTGDGLSDIYESAKVERGSNVSLDIRYVFAANTTIGEYNFDAYFVAEPK